MHCEHPACATACPLKALHKTEEGPVLYRADRCFGCRYCMLACPFEIPTFEWDQGMFAGPWIRKCTMCADRLSVGREPACVQTCPTGALKYGQRDELLAYAHERIQKYPDKYLQHVYGEKEVGGTSVLYISHVPFEQLGLPADLGDEADLPLRRGRHVLHADCSGWAGRGTHRLLLDSETPAEDGGTEERDRFQGIRPSKEAFRGHKSEHPTRNIHTGTRPATSLAELHRTAAYLSAPSHPCASGRPGSRHIRGSHLHRLGAGHQPER